jgi:hypothetical protein
MRQISRRRRLPQPLLNSAGNTIKPAQTKHRILPPAQVRLIGWGLA